MTKVQFYLLNPTDICQQIYTDKSVVQILKTRGGTTLNAWEVFTDVVEDVIVIEIEEVSDFWNLYVDVVRTIY